MSNTGSDEVERFSWVLRSTIQDAACLTFVRGTDVELIGRRFGAIPEHLQELDFDDYCEEAFAHQENYPVIGLRAIGGWTLVAEDSGLQGTRPEVLRRVSAGGEVVSAHWDAGGLSRFSHASGGAVRTSFEPPVPGYRTGTDPDGLEQLRNGLPWPGAGEPGADPVELMLALTARITGSPLEPEWLEGEFATYPVAAWPQDLPDSPEAVVDEHGVDRLWPAAGAHVGAASGHLAASAGGGPVIAGSAGGFANPAQLLAAVRSAGPERCRRVAGRIAYRVLEVTGAVGEPQVGAVLSALDGGRGPELSAITELVRLRCWELRRRRVTSTERARVRALELLRQAANPDACTALLTALAAARGMRVEQDEISELARSII